MGRKKSASPFTNLDLSKNIRICYRQWAKDLACDNILWITQETLRRLGAADERIWKWTVDAEQGVTSHKPVLQDRLFKKWRWVSESPWLKRLKSAKKVEKDGVHYVIAPIWGPQSRKVIGYVQFESVSPKLSIQRVRAIQAKIQEVSVHLEFCHQFMNATDQSFIDDLTTLYNQRYLPIVLDREIERMGRMQKKFSVLFLDIDFFKRVNDTRGHWIGSKLLIEVAKIIKKCTRSCDYGFRYGGDEFLVVLVDTGPENGQMVAERIRGEIERHDFWVDAPVQGIGGPVKKALMKLTVSIGVAAYPDHAKTTVDLIQLADQAMYYGKNKSRNVVSSAG